MNSIFTDIKNIGLLTEQGIRISDLFFADTILSDLYFITGSNIESFNWYDAAANAVTASPEYDSTKTTYTNLSVKIFDSIRTSNLTLNGSWRFGNNKNNILLQSTKTLDMTAVLSDLAESESTLNVEYFKNKILQEIYNLSSYIYDRPHLPSNVGDVIFSTSLTSTAQVQGIYAGRWARIEGDRFIIGHGPVNENTMTKYGEISEGMYNITTQANSSISEINFSPGLTINGKSKVALLNNFKLSDNYLVEHTHKFSADDDSFEIQWIRGWGGIPHELRDEDVANTTGTVDIHGYSMPKQCYREHSFTWNHADGKVAGYETARNMAVGGHSKDIIEDGEYAQLKGIPVSIQHKGTHTLTMTNYVKNADPTNRQLKTTTDVYTIEGKKAVHARSTPPTHYNYPPFMTVYMYHRIS